MTLEAQRIAIAEACGWAVNPLWPVTPTHAVYQRGDELRVTRELPDYLNDLNAMHEAEKTLASDKEAADFDRELSTIVLNDWDDGLINSMEWHATAAHRAEAFLRAIGKWEESP